MTAPAKVSTSFLHQQITESLRIDICSGKLVPGDRLPPMEELGKVWGTSYFTVRRAVAPLIREGLLESRGKLGTVVIGLKPTLTTVGVYYGTDVWSIPEAAFYRSLHQELRRWVEGRGLKMQVIVDPRPDGGRATPHVELLRMVEDRAIQGLMIPIADRYEMDWLTKLAIPKSYLGSAAVPWAVRIHGHEGLRKALARLREQGVRDVGLILGGATQSRPDHPTNIGVDIFCTLVEEFGMRTHETWISNPHEAVRPEESERYGYEAFGEIWDNNRDFRPEALICISDVIGRGVLFALLERQIEVPKVMKIVQFKNQQIGFFSPLKIDWLIYDERDIAKALLTLLQREVNGDPPREIVVEPRCE